MPAVSVIIPIYNVERYLPQCLESLLAQTLADIELVCVNDGSTDSSGEIVQSHANRDARIRVIEQENSGYGVAVNRGITAATGEYVAIVEPDDFIAPDAFERLVDAAEANGHPDIVKANFYRFNDERGEWFAENFKEEICGRVFSPAEENTKAVFDSIPAIWAAIYRRDLLEANGIACLETPGASYQDNGFVYKAFIAADSLLLVHDGFLRYRTDNQGSSVKSSGKVFCVCEEFASIERFLENHPEKREKIAPALAKKKYVAYRWNYRRLAQQGRREFLPAFSAEMAAARKAGLLHEDLFSKRQWRDLNCVIDDPDDYENRTRAEEEAKRQAKTSSRAPAKKGVLEKAVSTFKRNGASGVARAVKKRLSKRSKR